jgi:hypothetical protein
MKPQCSAFLERAKWTGRKLRKCTRTRWYVVWWMCLISHLSAADRHTCPPVQEWRLSFKPDELTPKDCWNYMNGQVYWSGNDKFGRPTMIIRLCYHKVVEKGNKEQMDELLRFVSYLMEEGIRRYVADIQIQKCVMRMIAFNISFLFLNFSVGCHLV